MVLVQGCRAACGSGFNDSESQQGSGQYLAKDREYKLAFFFFLLITEPLL